MFLGRYTGLSDILIGTPNAGRNHIDLENQIGFYINVLVIRNSIEAGDSFLDFYERAKTSTANSFNHEVYPFDRLVEDLNVEKDRSRNPIFDVILTLQNASEKRDDIEISASDVNTIKDRGEIFAKFDGGCLFQMCG